MTLHFFTRWRFVMAYFVICFALFEVRLRSLKEDTHLLSRQKSELEEAIVHAKALNKELTLKHNSQSDPAWVELTLMRELGVVPEGHTKVVFELQEPYD